MEDKKIKVLIFHQWLAPYRIDQFNLLNKLFDLEVIYLFSNLAYDKFNQDILLSKCEFKIRYLLKGIHHKSRVFRLGVLKSIREIKPDVILSYEYSFTTQYLVLLKSLGFLSQKLGTLVDDSLDICYNPRSGVRSFARQISLRQIDYLVLLSKDVSDFYSKRFNIKESQTIVSPILQLPEIIRDNEVLLEKTADQYITKYNLQGKKVLLYVGRLSYEKALPEFIENIHQLLLRDNDLMFVIVGNGDNLNIIKNTVEQRNLKDKVVFAGRYESHELHAWYLCGSGLVLPSISEPFGAVINESLIFGTKVLCSELAGASTLINSDNGIIFNPLDKQDTFEKTKKFISQIKPVSNIDLSKSPSIMASHPYDYLSEWNKVSI